MAMLLQKKVKICFIKHESYEFVTSINGRSLTKELPLHVVLYQGMLPYLDNAQILFKEVMTICIVVAIFNIQWPVII